MVYFNGKFHKYLLQQCCCLLFITSIVMSKKFGLITPIGKDYVIDSNVFVCVPCAVCRVRAY